MEVRISRFADMRGVAVTAAVVLVAMVCVGGASAALRADEPELKHVHSTEETPHFMFKDRQVQQRHRAHHTRATTKPSAGLRGNRNLLEEDW